MSGPRGSGDTSNPFSRVNAEGNREFSGEFFFGFNITRKWKL